MRDFKGMKRQRGRNRGGGQGGGKPQHNVNRAFDSQGPENIKIRGHAQHVYEKYSALARDALSAGDRVLGENYMQHAEHYFRTLRAIQPNRPASDIAARDSFTSGIDIDFEDEALETAMEEADAQAAERVATGGSPTGQTGGANGSSPAEGEGAEARGERFEGRRDRYDQNQNGTQSPNRERFQNDRYQGDRNPGDRSQGDRTQGERAQGDGGDREFRRDRQSGDRQNGDRQNADRQNADRQNADRQGGEFRRDRQDQNREGGRDRTEFRRDRADRPDRQERGERQDRGERQERWAPDRAAEASTEPQAAAPVASSGSFEPTAVQEPTAAVLRSRDGEESHAPAFLGSLTSAAPEAVAEPRRPRTRTRRPRREDGDAPAGPVETEEA